MPANKCLFTKFWMIAISFIGCLFLNSCWGGGAWMLHSVALAVIGTKSYENSQTKRNVSLAQLEQRYAQENEKRRKLGLPPITDAPEDHVDAPRPKTIY